MKTLILLILTIWGHSLWAQTNDTLTTPYKNTTGVQVIPDDTIIKVESPKPEIPALFLVEIYTPMGLSQGQFKEISNSMWGVGIGGAFLYNPFTKSINPKLIRPYLLGLQMDYTWFSSSPTNTTITLDQRNYNVQYKFNTGAFSFGYLGKIEFFNSKVYPFIAYQVGLRYFEGVQKIKYTAEFEADQHYAPTDFRETVSGSFTAYLGYGAGIGFGTGTARFEFKIMRQMGSQAKYIDPKSVVSNPNNTFSYSTKISTTNMFVPQLTLSLHF